MAATHHPLPVSMYIICLCYLLSLTSAPPGLATALSFNFNFSSSNSGDLCVTELWCERDARMGSGVIDLTRNQRKANSYSTGRASYRHPLPLWDSATGEVASFSSNFTFQIRPQTETFTHCNSSGGMGDGMAFFLARYPSSIPPDSYGMNLALFSEGNNFKATGDDRVVAVEFDTYLNPMAMDHSNNHVGIDVNSINSQAYTNVAKRLGSAVAVVTAEVTYDNRTRVLAARLNVSGDERWYTVTTSVDMKEHLPQQVAVGFSGASGECIGLHQVLSWSFSSTLVPPTSSRRPRWLVPVLVPSATVAFLLLLCVVATLVCRRRIWDSKDDDDEEEHEQAEFERGLGPRRYGYHELAAATQGFAEEEKLGRGGFGNVYRGSLGDQEGQVAIKMFSSESSVQGRKEFEAEVKIISRLRHRNLVHLLGWSDSRRGLLLVYELVAEGSLDRHIHISCLTWAERYKIILGLGSALRYLHTEWAQCVLHGDIKPSNILLDSSRSTKLGDFGLARLVDHGSIPRTTQVIMGTAGYIDPEFIRTRRLTTESDVYSFGMVLLEVVTGQRPMDMSKEQPTASADTVAIPLVKWVWDLYEKSAILEAVDERLNGDEHLGDDRDGKWQVHRALVVGLWCTHPDPSARPSVMQFMNVLQSKEATVPTLSRPGPSSYIFHGSHGYNASSSSANVCSDVSWVNTGR